MGIPVRKNFDDLDVEFDAVMVTDATSVGAIAAQAIQRFGTARVLIPDLLRGHIRRLRAA